MPRGRRPADRDDRALLYLDCLEEKANWRISARAPTRHGSTPHRGGVDVTNDRVGNPRTNEHAAQRTRVAEYRRRGLLD